MGGQISSCIRNGIGDLSVRRSSGNIKDVLKQRKVLKRHDSAFMRIGDAAGHAHAAALTEGAQVRLPVVSRIAVQMHRREHDAGHPKSSCLHEVGPSGHPTSAIPGQAATCSSSNHRPSGRQRTSARCGRPQPWHLPPARVKRTWRLELTPVRWIERRSSGRMGRAMPPSSQARGRHWRGQCRAVGRPPLAQVFAVAELANDCGIDLRLPPLVDAAAFPAAMPSAWRSFRKLVRRAQARGYLGRGSPQSQDGTVDHPMQHSVRAEPGPFHHHG